MANYSDTHESKAGPSDIYVEMTVRDPEAYKQYTNLSAPAVKAAGGRYLAHRAYAGR